MGDDDIDRERAYFIYQIIYKYIKLTEWERAEQGLKLLFKVGIDVLTRFLLKLRKGSELGRHGDGRKVEGVPKVGIEDESCLYTYSDVRLSIPLNVPRSNSRIRLSLRFLRFAYLGSPNKVCPQRLTTSFAEKVRSIFARGE